MHSLRLILSNTRYFAVVWVFCSLNIMIGTWVLYIPHVKHKLQLNDAQLGIALFCLALGLMSFMPVIPWITKRFGLGRTTIVGIVLFAMAFLLPLLTPSYIMLCLALYIVGVFSGVTDIAMNALVSELEQKDGVSFMAAAHGFFSSGGVIGAVLGSLLMGLVTVPQYHMLLIALVVIVSNLLLCKHYIKQEETPAVNKKEKRSFKAFKPLMAMAFIAMIVMGSEGAIEHWSTLYLTEIVQIENNSLTGLGFIMFSACMTTGRFFGDMISNHFGSIKVVLLGCVCALAGYILVAIGTLITATLGFGIVGLGLSVIIPELIRIAGKTEGISASAGISFVSGVGFIGFSLGPVILGFISDNFGLKMSFMFLLFSTVLAIMVSAFRARHLSLTKSY
ncbi:MFS transporter [Seonamhaeicola sp.]|uniref:MFS transporter n=1 Tax=Seonamhaeicola sp. TaxID=1912245 RepID=UPI00261B9109|nr:MFS transporter [Seonamhaeicola sp.]